MRLGLRSCAMFLGSLIGLAPSVAAQETGTCTTGEAEALLYVNDVRARLFNDGSLFWRGGSHVYEVPKGEGTQAIFAAGIWIGGLVDGSLRLAGARYRSYEFWPGPLNDDGTLPNPNDCSAFDQIYEITQTDITEFENTGTVSASLEQWPWQLGAPVEDGDGNPDNYNLAGGDRPAIRGHQTQWWVMNDLGGPHLSTQGQPMGMEVQVSAFAALNDVDAINEATLYQYKLVYRGQAPLEDAYFSLFVDADLGNFDDDYVGSDTTLGLAFVYNADDNDEGQAGYGPHPPALGVKFVEGPVTADGQTLEMTNFMSFFNGAGVQGDPFVAADYYNYMQSRWRDGQALTEGGSGREFSTIPASFMYPGDPVAGAFWSQRNSDGSGTAVPPSDQRFVLSTGPFDMQPGDEQVITLAIVWAQGADHLDSVTQLRAAAQTVQDAWDDGFDFQFDIEAPSRAPTLLAPADGITGQPDQLTLHWMREDGVSGYEVEVATDAAFTSGVRTALPGPIALDLEGLQAETTYYWRVRSENPGGFSPWSEAFRFTTSSLMFEDLGPLLLADGTPAFVEVAGPGGADPCSVGATSTEGCTEVGGNGVYGSLNSTGDYVMYHLGSVGPEGSIGAYAPSDFEMRFTAEGSFAMHIFTSSRVIRVPFEIWDIGPTPPGTANDPHDDIQLIPVVFSDYGGDCTYGYGEIPASDSPIELSWEGTERAYGYYPLTSYADWDATVAPLVENDAQNCPVFDNGTDLIDRTRGRPLQRVVFFGNEAGAHYRPEGPPEGTVVRFYSTTLVHAPVLAAPEDQAADLTQPLTLWWNVQGLSQAEVQVSTTANFSNVVAEANTITEEHYTISNLAEGTYFWRVRRIDGAGRTGPWSAAWQFSLSASKSVATEAEGDLPATYALEANYPNPFNPETVIRFALPQAGPVRLDVYDILGRRVTTLFEGALPAGWHSAVWRAQGVGTGVYFYRVEAGAFQATRRMLLVK